MKYFKTLAFLSLLIACKPTTPVERIEQNTKYIPGWRTGEDVGHYAIFTDYYYGDSAITHKISMTYFEEQVDSLRIRDSLIVTGWANIILDKTQ